MTNLRITAHRSFGGGGGRQGAASILSFAKIAAGTLLGLTVISLMCALAAAL